jgi:hypothetical protein
MHLLRRVLSEPAAEATATAAAREPAPADSAAARTHPL